MTSPRAQIGFFEPSGKPVGYITRDDPFVVIAQVPGDGEPAKKITVPVGDEELELTLDPTAKTPTYISEATTMGELGVDADHGESAAATVDGATASVEVHHNNFEASFAQLNAFFNQQYKFWTTFLFNLQSEETDDLNVQLWIETAKTKISLINRGRYYLNDDRKLAKFRLDSGTYYAGRVRGGVSSPSLLQFWATYGQNTLGAEQDRLRINRYRRDAKDAAWDAVLGLVGALLIGLYEEITDATFAGPIYQLITGENIYGRKDSRGTALLEIAFGAALEVIGFKLERWLGSGPRRAWSRPDPDAPRPKVGKGKPRPRQGDVDLNDPDLPGGTLVHPRDAGMTEGALAQLQYVGRKHGATFVFRGANKASLRHQENGCPFKPMAIKQKTIKEIDYHIGAPRKYDGDDAEGLVGFFEPRLPKKRPDGMSDEMWDAVQARYRMRKKEWDKLQGDIKNLEDLGLVELRDGLIIDTGLSEFVRRSKPGSMPGPDAARFAGKGTGKPFTGDYDPFSIVRRGRELSDEEAADILEEIKDVFVKIQHGSNRAWRAGDKYAHVKAGIEFDHTGKDTEMYKALSWHLEGKHAERLQGLSSSQLRKEALESGIEAAGNSDADLIDSILDKKGWRAKSKGEALIVVVPEPGASPIAYWHGEPVPEGTFKEILDQAGVEMADLTRRGFDANGQAILRAFIFTDEDRPQVGGPVKSAEEVAADVARSARLEATQKFQAWQFDTNAALAEEVEVGDDESEDVEAETGDLVTPDEVAAYMEGASARTVERATPEEVSAYMETGAIPERFQAAAAREYLTSLTYDLEDAIEITDADVERYVETGEVPEALEEAAAEHDAELLEGAKEDAEAAKAPETAQPAGGFAERLQALGQLIRSIPPLLFWALGGAIGLFVLITALGGGGEGDDATAARPQATTPATQPAPAGDGGEEAPGDTAAEGGAAPVGADGVAPAGGGAGAPQLPPGTPADQLMVVRVGGGGTDGEEGALLPIHQFMVVQPHSPTIIITFSGGDDLDVFPDQLVYTDESYEGDPVSACRDPHFHMPEFMPTGMDLEGNIVPEPNAQGCGYGRVSEAFPIRVPAATADAWQNTTGWDPRDGEPKVKLIALIAPFVTDAAAVDAKIKLIIQNVGQVPWSTIELDDSTFGNVLVANADLISNDCTGPIALTPFEKKKCTYEVRIDRTMGVVADVPNPVTGEPETREVFTTSVEITVQDEDGNLGGDSYVPIMYFAAYFVPLEVEKTSDPQTLDQPDPVTFTITIRNNGTEPLDIVQVLDTEYGDLLNEKNPRVRESDCPDLPEVIETNQELSCSFIGDVGSNQEDGNHLNEVFVTASDPAGDLGMVSDDLRIPIANPGPIDTSGTIMWELFLAEGLIDSIPDGVSVGG